jgi:hypothetical protein
VRTTKCCWLALICITSLQVSIAAKVADIPCEQVHLAAQIAGAGSLAAVEAAKKKAGTGYIVEIISAFRAFELQPKNKVLAEGLLKMIPRDDTQQEIVGALDTSMCDREDDADISILAGVRYSLPAMLAKAVRLAPAYMFEYVSYSLKAAPDPHSDYAIQMQRVCRVLHPEFMKAVGALAESEQKWFTTGIFDPKRCKAIAVREAD